MPADLSWHDYGSGLWCLQERECSKPVAMVWRERRSGVAATAGMGSRVAWRGVLWGTPEHRVWSAGKRVGRQKVMDAIDRLREGR